MSRRTIHVINAGDGRHAHPTQALLDMFTIRHYKKEFHNLRVAIVGDVLHSRVARSQIHALTTLGVPEVRVIAPKTLLPTQGRTNWACRSTTTWTQGLKDVDVVMMLRLQNERMQGALLPSAQEYFKYYGLTPEKLALAKPRCDRDAPGPDESRRGDRLQRGGRRAVRDPAAGDFRHRGAHGGDEYAGGRASMNIHIKNGRLIDPTQRASMPSRIVFIADGMIAAIGKAPHGFVADQVIDASGLIVMPGPGGSRGASARAGLRIQGHAGIGNGRRGGGRRDHPGLPARHRSAAG